MRAPDTLPPEEQSNKSTPKGARILAKAIESSTVQPPSLQSVAEMRMNSGYCSGQLFLTAVTTSHNMRVRFEKVPP